MRKVSGEGERREGDRHTHTERSARGAEFLRGEKTARASGPLGQGWRRADTRGCAVGSPHRTAPHASPTDTPGEGGPVPRGGWLAPARVHPAPRRSPAGTLRALLGRGPRLLGRVGAHPAAQEGLTQSGGSSPALPAGSRPGWLLLTGRQRLAVPGAGGAAAAAAWPRPRGAPPAAGPQLAGAMPGSPASFP